MQADEKADLIRSIGAVIQETVAKAVEPLQRSLANQAALIAEQAARIETLESLEPVVGEKGEPGAPGKDGVPGAAGEPGTGLAGAIIDRKGHLLITMTNGATVDLGPVVGRDGEPGAKGADGLGFDDLDIIHDGLRTFTFRLKRADLLKEWVYRIPVQIHAGIFKAEATYEQGDVVTWGGSSWHCDLDGTKGTTPGTPGSGWTLCTKKGRDGKNGDKGDKGDRGDRGPAGADFTLPVGDMRGYGHGVR